MAIDWPFLLSNSLLMSIDIIDNIMTAITDIWLKRKPLSEKYQ